MEISIGGADIQEIVSMAATGGVFVLLAGWLWVNRDVIKSALSKVASKVKQSAPATVAAHSCEQFNAEVLDVVGLCIEMGDDEGAAQMLDLMKRHNVAAAKKSCVVGGWGSQAIESLEGDAQRDATIVSPTESA